MVCDRSLSIEHYGIVGQFIEYRALWDNGIAQ